LDIQVIVLLLLLLLLTFKKEQTAKWPPILEDSGAIFDGPLVGWFCRPRLFSPCCLAWQWQGTSHFIYDWSAENRPPPKPECIYTI